MNVTSCEKKENKTAELTVVVSPEEFDKALDEAYKKNKHQIAVPGFRKGKAPRKIVEAMYGASVFHNDALEIIMPSVCSQGVTDSGLRTVGYPKIMDISYGDDKSATLTYAVELYPEIDVPEYKGITAPKPVPIVEEKNVDSEIASVQLRNARIQTATRPAVSGDTAVIDYEGFVDGKPFEGGKGEGYELALGSNTFIPGFEAKIQGMAAGEERDLDLEFPAEYHQKDLAGKPVVFKVKVREIKEKILPELDDEFAKDVSEFDTLQEYRNSVREKLMAAKEAESQKAFEEFVLSRLGQAVEEVIPAAMIEDFVDNQMENFRRQLTSYGMDMNMYLNMMGTNEEGFRQNMRPGAIAQIKTALALEKVAEAENIQPSEEEIDKYYEEVAKRYSVETKVAQESLSKDGVIRELQTRAAMQLVIAAAIPVEPTAQEAAADESVEPEASADTEAEPAKEKKSKKSKSEDKMEAAGETASEDAAEKKTAKKAPSKKSADTADNDE